MRNPSLADNAVDALATVREIGKDMPDDHPMRFIVHSMRRAAEAILSDAMRQAVDISYTAKLMIKDHDEAVAETRNSSLDIRKEPAP